MANGQYEKSYYLKIQKAPQKQRSEKYFQLVLNENWSNYSMK